jgi:hypothetical protein
MLYRSAKISFQKLAAFATMATFLTISAFPVWADEGADAKAVADAYLKLIDRDDVDGAYQKVGEQWKRTTSKAEWMAGVKNWLAAKGGASSERSIVGQRTMSEEEARQYSPTIKGNTYMFRYRSSYPRGVFFEDVSVNRDSDNVLRVGGHKPQPAE